MNWGRVTHICVSRLPAIGSDNGLAPSRRQAIIWTNAGILLIGPLSTKFSEILIGIPTFSFKKMRLKVSSAKWRSCCLGLNVLIKHHHCKDIDIMTWQRFPHHWFSARAITWMSPVYRLIRLSTTARINWCIFVLWMLRREYAGQISSIS